MFYHGKGSKVYLNGNPMSSFTDNVNVSISADTVETTTFIDTAKKYVAGLKNATLTAEGFGAGSTGEIDQYLQAAIDTTGSNIWTWYPNEVAGMSGYGMLGSNTQYDIKASISGAVRVAAACQSNVGKEPVMCIRAMAEATISSQGATVDGGAKSTSGGAGYLQVSAENIADAQAYIEHSSDGSSWETLAAFSTASIGASAQRTEITGEIRRYVRSSVTATTNVTYGTALCRF
jgi:hypothetical protein